jgi:hypothetical protein
MWLASYGSLKGMVVHPLINIFYFSNMYPTHAACFIFNITLILQSRCAMLKKFLSFSNIHPALVNLCAISFTHILRVHCREGLYNSPYQMRPMSRSCSIPFVLDVSVHHLYSRGSNGKEALVTGVQANCTWKKVNKILIYIYLIKQDTTT